MSPKDELLEQYNSVAIGKLDTIRDLKSVMLNYDLGLITTKEFNKQLADLSKSLNKAIIK